MRVLVQYPLCVLPGPPIRHACIDVTNTFLDSGDTSSSRWWMRGLLGTNSALWVSGACLLALVMRIPLMYGRVLLPSDGISMGTSGMRYSLQSRDLIADQVETAAGGHWLDGMVVIPGCDKNMPGVLMACTSRLYALSYSYQRAYEQWAG